MLRVYIPTKNRADIISTHRVLDGFDWQVVVHDEQQRAAYLGGGIPEDRIVVSNTPGDVFGLTRQREFVCRQLVKPGEWFLFADDNVKEFVAVDDAHWRYGELPVQDGRDWNPVFKASCDNERLQSRLEECIEVAEKTGACVVGFATTDNYFFLGKKYRQVGYVIGKVMLWKNDPSFSFDHTITMEDFRNTAQHLLQFGCVLVCNYIIPRANHYQHGGMGSYDERLSWRLQDVKMLLKQYPGLFRVHDRKGFAYGSDLSIKLSNLKQVSAWRRSLLGGQP